MYVHGGVLITDPLPPRCAQYIPNRLPYYVHAVVAPFSPLPIILHHLLAEQPSRGTRRDDLIRDCLVKLWVALHRKDVHVRRGGGVWCRRAGVELYHSLVHTHRTGGEEVEGGRNGGDVIAMHFLESLYGHPCE